jgi:hypothetical protein
MSGEMGFNEHDLVRLTADVTDDDGKRATAGQTGTIVSVYPHGSFLVELSGATSREGLVEVPGALLEHLDH